MKLPEDKLDLIIEILNQHDKRFEQMEASNLQRFEQMDKRFEQMEKNNTIHFNQIYRRFDQMENSNMQRFEQMINSIKEEKHEREKMENKLDKVYETRDKVKISFGWQWSAVSMLIAVIAAFLGGGLAIAFIGN